MNQHHLSIRVKLDCGCDFETRIAGEDIVNRQEEIMDFFGIAVSDDTRVPFPSGAASFLGMLMSFQEDILALITSDGHLHNGNENITIEVRTKVGELPTPEEWRERRGDEE